MKQEDKDLLLKELCTRQACRVKVQYNGKIYTIDYVSSEYEEVKLDIPDNYTVGISEVKPYLRPMSNMTEEEWEELNHIGHIVPLYDGCFGVDMRAYCKNSQPHYRRFSEFSTIEDWFNAHHLDYRGLIPMGLALEAPDGMYNLKQL